MITNKETLQEMQLVYGWTVSTHKTYTIALKEYTNLHKKNIQELLLEAEKDEENIRKVGKRRIKKRLIQYQLHLQNEKEFSPNSVKTYLSKICKIYKYHEIDLPELPPIHGLTLETFEDIPTFEEIQHAVFNSRTKMKALITFIASTGLRRGDVARLTLHDFCNATREYHNDKYGSVFELLARLEKEDTVIPTWNVTDQKTGVNHITFSSHESTYYIIQMLRERLLREEVTLDSSLFSVKPDTITSNFKHLNDSLGYGRRDGKAYFHPHALRKYFATTLTNHDVDYLATEFMMGHKLKRSMSSYYFANPERLKQKYTRVMDRFNFTFNVTYVDVSSREMQELRELREYKRATEKRMLKLEETLNLMNNDNHI